MKNEPNRIKIKSMDKDSQVIRLLKSAYEKSGKSYTDIFNETGCAQQVISKVLNGKQYASLATLYKIGKAINLKPKQIAEVWKKDKISEIDAEIAKFLETT